MNSKLNLNKIPKIVGESTKKKFDEIYNVLVHTNWPVYLTGPSGSGKTLTAMNLAKMYALENDVEAYYIQLSPEQTKTSVILGLRLIDGSLKPFKGVLAQCMQKGGIIIVDEATHTTQELLLMFNSILDRTSVTSIGDEIVYAKKSFRIIFCSNDSRYAGNVRLPQSFAQRLVTFKFDYPEWIDEAKIIRKIAKDECNVELKVSGDTIKYITSLLREIRTNDFPLSARNGAIAIVRLNLLEYENKDNLDIYFSENSNIEAIRKVIATRIFNETIKDASMAISPRVGNIMQYISDVGVDNFKNIILSSFMYYLDVEGIILDSDIIKNKIYNSII